MATVQYSWRSEHYSERAAAARGCLTFSDNYASRADIVSHIATQLHDVSFPYGAVDNIHRPAGTASVNLDTIRREIHHILAKPVWETQIVSPFLALGKFTDAAKTVTTKTVTTKIASSHISVPEAYVGNLAFLDQDISAQLDSNQSYSFPRFSDISDIEVKKAIAEGVGVLLLGNGTIKMSEAAPVQRNRKRNVGRRQRKSDARKRTKIPATDTFDELARRTSIENAYNAIQHKRSYATTIALQDHIKGQLGSNRSYSHPRFRDIDDLEVKKIITEGVISLLLGKGIIRIRSLTTPIEKASSTQRRYQQPTLRSFSSNFILTRSEETARKMAQPGATAQQARDYRSHLLQVEPQPSSLESRMPQVVADPRLLQANAQMATLDPRLLHVNARPSLFETHKLQFNAQLPVSVPPVFKVNARPQIFYLC